MAKKQFFKNGWIFPKLLEPGVTWKILELITFSPTTTPSMTHEFDHLKKESKLKNLLKTAISNGIQLELEEVEREHHHQFFFAIDAV